MIRFLLRALLTTGLLLLAATLVLGSLFLQDEPVLPAMAAPSPEDVRAAREFVHQVRRVTEAEAPAETRVTLSVDALRGALRMGSRFLPDYRATAVIEQDSVQAMVAVPVPWPGGVKWLNARVEIPPFEGVIAPSRVEIGGRALSPDLSVWLARTGANLLFGGAAGEIILNSASAMLIADDTMVFALALDRDGRGEVVQGVFGSMRGDDMPSAERIDRHYTLIREAMDAGDLPVRGSFLPHIRFALAAALDDSDATSLADAYTAAIFGLTRACGARDFALVVGRLAESGAEDPRTWRTDCRNLTLAGRVDLRRHFITAAAIKAASTRGFAISLGEFKELHDSLSRGSGFDFTDILANNAGIRMSERFLAQPRDAWGDLIARIEGEGDLLPSLDGVPGLLPRDQFEARFGDVDSPEYRAMIATIEARIDRLRLHDPSDPSG